MTSAAVRVVEYERPWLYPKQERAIFCPERYALIEASTKAGKTAGCIAWIIEQAIGMQPGHSAWWIAPVYPQAKIAFRRVSKALREGLPPDLFRVRQDELTVELVGAGTIWFKSGEVPDNLYGEDVFAAVVDEASRVREESWHAVRSTLTHTRGPIRIIGNVKGRKNWFFRLARKAQAGAPGMAYSKIIAADAVAAGVLRQDEIEDAKRVLPAHVFSELYEAEPSDDAGNPFGAAAIASCKDDLSTASPVCWGWDLAKSIDWTWGIALDAEGRMCRSERWQGPWEATIGKIHGLVGDVPSLVDSTGLGDPVLESLQKGHGNFTGYKFTATSKQMLMEGLAVAIQSRAVRIAGDVLLNELESFEYVYTRTGVHYSAPEGLHDDGVCALALAIQAKSQLGRHAPLILSTVPFIGV